MQTIKTSTRAVLMALGMLALTAQGAVEPFKLFNNRMVLPRGCAFPVWGKAAPNEKVTVTFGDKSAVATADANGDWETTLGPLAASATGAELAFAGSNKVVFKDVLVGDVFLYAGSTFSNSRFEWPNEKKNPAWTAEIEKASKFKRGIRYIYLESCGASLTPVTYQIPKRVHWFAPSDPHAPVGQQVMTWLFASRYFEKTGVPCGIVSASAQFRKNENYLSPAALEMSDAVKKERESYMKALKVLADFGANAPDVKDAKDDMAFAGRGLAPTSSGVCCNYNASIHPILRFSFAGAIYVPEPRQGWQDKKVFRQVNDLIVAGWRAGARKDFPTYVYDGKQDRVAFADDLVKNFSSGAKPEPLPERTFKLELPPDEQTDADKFEIAGIFGDYMVLQHGKPHPVWGRGKPGARVTVSYAGKTATATVDGKGDWVATLPALDVQKTGLELTVACGAEKTVFKDVLCGDVWHCSGQSNMEFSFGWGVIHAAAEKAKTKDFPNIRANKFRHARSLAPVTWASPAGRWNRCTPESIGGVTAVGYFFAQRINAETGMPIGLLDTGWSDSRIEPFTPMCGMRKEKSFEKQADAMLASIATVIAAGKRATARLKAGAVGIDAFAEETPLAIQGNGWSSQYNTLIEPNVLFPTTGILWYQGCSNRGGREYVEQMRAFVGGWREKLKSPDLPIVIIQLAGYQKGNGTPAGADEFAIKREAQREAYLEIPHAGLAVSMDVGNVRDIHPHNKRDVGERAALWALRDVYGKKDLVVSGPMYKSMKLEGAKARLTFDFVGGGLVAAEKEPDSAGEMPKETPGAKLKGFSLQDAAGAWHFAEGVIDGDTVVVSSSEVTEAKNVRYAYRASAFGAANLYNKEGLPAVPFKTDPWGK